MAVRRLIPISLRSSRSRRKISPGRGQTIAKYPPGKQASADPAAAVARPGAGRRLAS